MCKKIGRKKGNLAASCLAAALFAGGCADLVVTDVHHEPFTGAARQVKATVKNQGSSAAAASTTRLEVKPAGSATFTRSATAATPALSPGQQIEFPISALPPSELPAPGSGQCLELKACADSTDAVWEGLLWEGNNCRTSQTCR